MVDIAELGITINSKGVEQGVRRLGELGKAGERSEVQLASLAKGVGNVAKVATAAATAVAGLVVVVGQQVKENDGLANSLGISTTKLQQFQAAAKTVGLSADDMGQALKDVSDKVGDFLTTGGGEGADIFEQLSVSAKDLQNLDPADQLRKIGEALKEVESRSEQVFFAESLASDLSLMLPLITDNTEELDRLLDKSLQTGAALSAFDNTALIETSESFERMGAAVSGATRLLAANLSPAVILVQEKIEQMISAFDKGDIEKFVEFGIDSIGVLLDVVQTLEMGLRLSGIGWTQIASLATGAMAESADAVAGLVNLALKPLLVILENVAEGWGIITGALADITPGDVSDGFRAASESLASFSDQVANFEVTSGDIKDANEAVNKSLQEQISALDDLAKSPAYSDQFKARLAAIRKEIEARAVADEKARTESLGLATQTKKTQAELDAEAKAKEKSAKAAEKLAAKNKVAAESIKDQINPMRAITREYLKAKELFEKGLLTEEDLEAFAKILGDMSVKMGDAGEDAGESFAESFANGIESAAFSGGIKGVFDFLGDQLGKSISESVSKSISGSVSGDIGGILGGLGGGLIGGGAIALLGGILSGSSKKTIATGFDINIVGDTIGRAFETETIKKSSIFGSSTQTYRDAVSDVTLESINNSFDLVTDDLDRMAGSIGLDLTSFSSEIKVRSGDVSDALSVAAEEQLQASLPAIEKYRVVGESFADTFEKLAAGADIVNASLDAVGVSSESAAISAAESAQDLASAYQDQADTINSQITDIQNQIKAIEPSIGFFNQEFEQELFKASQTARAEIKTLESTLSALQASLTETLSRVSGAAEEVAIEFQQSLLKAVADIEEIPLDQAGNRLLSLTESYKENFFSSSELLNEAVDQARIDLSQFDDLGVTTETSFESLRSAIERFKDSEAFTPEGLARYLAAASALSDYSNAITDQARLSEDAANAIESSNDIIESSLSKLEETIGQSSATVEGVQSGQDLPGIMAGIKDEFRGVIDFIGGMRVSAEELQAAYDSATTAGLELVEPLSDTGIQVAQVYQDILGRLPDRAGLEYWVNDLESGALSFDQFFDLITKSDEAKLKDRFDGLLIAFNAYDAIAKLPPPPVEPVKEVVDIIQSVSEAGPSERDLDRIRDLFDHLRGVTSEERALENLGITADGVENFLAVIGGINQTPENLIALSESLGLSVSEFISSVETVKESIEEIPEVIEEIAEEIEEGLSQIQINNLDALLDTLRGISQQDNALAALGITIDDIESFLDVVGGMEQTPETLAAMAESLGLSTEDFISSINTISMSVDAQALQLESIQEQRLSLEQRYLNAINDTNALRALELDSLDESNKALLSRIFLLKDIETAEGVASDSLGKLRVAIDDQISGINDTYDTQIDALKDADKAEKDRIETLRDTTEQTISDISSLRDLLSTGIEATRSTQAFAVEARIAQARRTISQALEGARAGDLPGAEDLEGAISALSDVSSDQFSSAAEMAVAQAITANELKELDKLAGNQLTTEEETLQTLINSDANRKTEHQDDIDLLKSQRDEEIAAAESILTQNEDQLNALLGIDTSVLSVADAIAELTTSMQGVVSVRQAEQQSGMTTPVFSQSENVEIQHNGFALIEDDTGATYFTPGGGTHRVNGPDAAELLGQTYSSNLGFQSGGFTGNGPVDQIAGFVHGQEGVLNAGAMSNVGVPALNAMNSGMNPADLFRPSVTIDVSSIVNSVDTLRYEMQGALVAIASNTFQTSNILDGAKRGRALATVAQ